MPRLYSGAANDRPEIIKLPPIPEVVWQQPQESHLTNIHKILTTEINKNTHMPGSKQKTDVQSQTSPMKETSPKYPDPVRSHSYDIKLGARQYIAPMTPTNTKMKSNKMKST